VWLRRIVPAVAGLAGLAVVVVLLDPAAVGRALSRFRLALLPAIILLWLGVYALQGLRWHYLLRDAGARLRVRDSVVLNAAGQTITALIPLGDLTRAAFASEASGSEFGTVAATVTVQELTFTLMLILCAMPVLLTLHAGVALVVATLVGMVAIVVILTVSPVFCAVHRLLAHIPVLRRLLPAIDELQAETAALLHRPDALAMSALDLGRALLAITAFWLVVQAVSPGRTGWLDAAFVLALASIGGAISLIPGGIGASEAGMAGLLLLFGVDGGGAAAVALIQRVLATGIALALGLGAYAVARSRLRLGGLFELAAHHG
jgi:glycosyltransferase 2 family protein